MVPIHFWMGTSYLSGLNMPRSISLDISSCRYSAISRFEHVKNLPSLTGIWPKIPVLTLPLAFTYQCPLLSLYPTTPHF